MSEQKAWEKMTMAEQMSAARDRQASFRLESEVRKAARVRDLEAREVEGFGVDSQSSTLNSRPDLNASLSVDRNRWCAGQHGEVLDLRPGG
jgi:hypothetical protein